MVEIRGKESASGSRPSEEGMPADSIPRLCARCNAEMAVEEWDEFFLGMPEKVKKWFALPGADKSDGEQNPTPHHLSVGVSKKPPPQKRDEKDEQDHAIRRALADSYGLKRSGPQVSGCWGLRAPTRRQHPHSRRQHPHFGSHESRS